MLSADATPERIDAGIESSRSRALSGPLPLSGPSVGCRKVDADAAHSMQVTASRMQSSKLLLLLWSTAMSSLSYWGQLVCFLTTHSEASHNIM